MQYKHLIWQVQQLGDHAVLLSLPEQIGHDTSMEVYRLQNFLKALHLDFVKDMIPSYHTIVVVYDILKTNNDIILQFENLIKQYDTLDFNITDTINTKTIVIPVCYDLEFGIDLENISKMKNISIEQIIQTHCATTYDVYAIGFLPGFTYMGIVDKSIQMPRHPTPRKNVMAGSVGIAGMQTGIYPTNSPGGWQIIGRTPIQIFNRDTLSLCNVGDSIQFKSIDKATFYQLNEWTCR